MVGSQFGPLRPLVITSSKIWHREIGTARRPRILATFHVMAELSLGPQSSQPRLTASPLSLAAAGIVFVHDLRRPHAYSAQLQLSLTSQPQSQPSQPHRSLSRLRTQLLRACYAHALPAAGTLSLALPHVLCPCTALAQRSLPHSLTAVSRVSPSPVPLALFASPHVALSLTCHYVPRADLCPSRCRLPLALSLALSLALLCVRRSLSPHMRA